MGAVERNDNVKSNKNKRKVNTNRRNNLKPMGMRKVGQPPSLLSQPVPPFPVMRGRPPFGRMGPPGMGPPGMGPQGMGPPGMGPQNMGLPGLSGPGGPVPPLMPPPLFRNRTMMSPRMGPRGPMPGPPPPSHMRPPRPPGPGIRPMPLMCPPPLPRHQMMGPPHRFPRGMPPPMMPANKIRSLKGKVQPKKKNKKNQNQFDLNNPWVTDDIKAEFEKKEKMIAAARESKKPEDWELFKGQRSKCEKMYKVAKLEYIGKHPEEGVNKVMAEVEILSKIEKLANVESAAVKEPKSTCS